MRKSLRPPGRALRAFVLSTFRDRDRHRLADPFAGGVVAEGHRPGRRRLDLRQAARGVPGVLGDRVVHFLPLPVPGRVVHVRGEMLGALLGQQFVGRVVQELCMASPEAPPTVSFVPDTFSTFSLPPIPQYCLLKIRRAARTVFEQQPDCRLVLPASCELQGARIVFGSRVYVGTRPDQFQQRVVVAGVRRTVNRLHPFNVACFDICTIFKQQPNHITNASRHVGSHYQRCLSSCVADFQLRAVAQQCTCHFVGIRQDGFKKRCKTFARAGIHVGTAGHQQIDSFGDIFSEIPYIM